MRPIFPTLTLALTLIPGLSGHAQALSKHSRDTSRAGYYSAKTTYVTPPSGSLLAQIADATLAAWTRTQARDFVKKNREDFTHGKPSTPYYYQMTPFHARYFAPTLFSVAMVRDQYTGGAHGLTARTTFNFGIIDGHPKRLGLADFFAPGADYRTQVQRLLLAKLHHDERALFINDVKALSHDQLNRFVVEHDGLRFYFDPYEVGPYAAGPIDVKLTAEELGPAFRSHLPN
jgi:hypothetical protein